MGSTMALHRLGPPEGVEEGASLSVGDVEGFDIGRPLTEGLRLGMVEPAMLGLDDSMEALAFALVTSLLCDLATSPSSRPSARTKARSPTRNNPIRFVGRGSLVSLVSCVVSLQSPFGRCESSISPCCSMISKINHP